MSIEKLKELEKIYKEAQYPAQILEQSAQIPYPVLLISLSDTNSEQAQVLTFTYFPPEETEFDDIDCLQLFTQVQLDAAQMPSTDVWRYLSYLNRKLPFGTFQYGEDAQKFEFRHVIVAAFSDKIKKGFFIEILEIAYSLIEMFIPIIAELYQGKISYQEAIQQSQLE